MISVISRYGSTGAVIDEFPHRAAARSNRAGPGSREQHRSGGSSNSSASSSNPEGSLPRSTCAPPRRSGHDGRRPAYAIAAAVPATGGQFGGAPGRDDARRERHQAGQGSTTNTPVRRRRAPGRPRSSNRLPGRVPRHRRAPVARAPVVGEKALQDQVEAERVSGRQRRRDEPCQQRVGGGRAEPLGEGGLDRQVRPHAAAACAASASAAPVRARSASECAALTNQASNCDGGG